VDIVPHLDHGGGGGTCWVADEDALNVLKLDAGTGTETGACAWCDEPECEAIPVKEWWFIEPAITRDADPFVATFSGWPGRNRMSSTKSVCVYGGDIFL
jgi:hypothetical protein